MTQLWSTKPVAIDFGGKPSEGKVSMDIDVACRDYYFNFVTELWYTVRLIIECQQFRQLSEGAMEEACMREFMRVAGNKIQIETKADYKAKTGFSPDLFDALVVGVEGAKRKGFSVRRQKAPEADDEDDSWKKELQDKAKRYRQAGQLTYG